MKADKFMSADAAAALIQDGDTIGLIGGGGGLVEATLLHSSVQDRFLQTGHPRQLTCVHALGIGDRKTRGMNCFAYEDMVKRVIGGHWVWSPRMQELARDNKIEAYVLPGGVVMQLMREVAAKRPGLFTHVGLGTFVDPRHGGGKMNQAAKDDLVDVITIDDREYLRYRPFPINIALIKGSFADEDGNISLDQEPANVDIYAMAAAAHNSGGKVIVQVRGRVKNHDLTARAVRIPSAIIDAIVVDPDQQQSYDIVYDPSFSGEEYRPVPPQPAPEFSVRQIIARRAHAELSPGAVINYGFGIPDAVASIVAARGEQDLYYQTIEHGTYGGTLLTGTLFGYALNPSCMIDGPSQFDFYSGGGLDIAFLGFGELDGAGNVNVSRLGGLTVGPGGFIDIAQNARKVVFCGTFDAKGAKTKSGDGKLSIQKHGEVRKLLAEVDQITFSGVQALKQNQTVIYVTERAVFKLQEDGVHLIEIAPGVDLQRDIIGQIGFSTCYRTPARFNVSRILLYLRNTMNENVSDELNRLRRITLRDFYLLIYIPIAGTAAWLLPERSWENTTRSGTHLISALRGSYHWMKRVTRINRSGSRNPAPDQAASDKKAQHLLREQAHATHLSNFYTLRAIRPGSWEPQVKLHGKEHIESAQNQGRGVILWVLPMQFSNLISKAAFAQAGYKVVHLSRQSHGISRSHFAIRYLNPIWVGAENLYLDERIIIRGDNLREAMRRLSNSIKQKRIVSITFGNTGQRRYSGDLQGRRLEVSAGAISLAYRWNAALLPVLTVYTGNCCFNQHDLPFARSLRIR